MRDDDVDPTTARGCFTLAALALALTAIVAFVGAVLTYVVKYVWNW
jgi:hypothetical protein